MKPLASISVRKSISAIAVASALAFTVPGTGFANTGKEKTGNQVTESQVSVQYCGTDKDSYMFRVEFENPKAEKFSLIVKNDDGVIVFQQYYESTRFTTIVRLPKEDMDIHPTFVIHTANADFKRSFAVSRKLTEDYVVTKL
jgi:hypothetical protein